MFGGVSKILTKDYCQLIISSDVSQGGQLQTKSYSWYCNYVTLWHMDQLIAKCTSDITFKSHQQISDFSVFSASLW